MAGTGEARLDLDVGKTASTKKWRKRAVYKTQVSKRSEHKTQVFLLSCARRSRCHGRSFTFTGSLARASSARSDKIAPDDRSSALAAMPRSMRRLGRGISDNPARILVQAQRRYSARRSGESKRCPDVSACCRRKCEWNGVARVLSVNFRIHGPRPGGHPSISRTRTIARGTKRTRLARRSASRRRQVRSERDGER